MYRRGRRCCRTRQFQLCFGFARRDTSRPPIGWRTARGRRSTEEGRLLFIYLAALPNCRRSGGRGGLQIAHTGAGASWRLGDMCSACSREPTQRDVCRGWLGILGGVNAPTANASWIAISTAGCVASPLADTSTQLPHHHRRRRSVLVSVLKLQTATVGPPLRIRLPVPFALLSPSAQLSAARSGWARCRLGGRVTCAVHESKSLARSQYLDTVCRAGAAPPLDPALHLQFRRCLRVSQIGASWRLYLELRGFFLPCSCLFS